MEWLNRDEAIKAVREAYPGLNMDIFMWNNHVAQSSYRLDGIRRINQAGAREAGVDWDAKAPSHRTKYLYEKGSVIRYFATHGRRATTTAGKE
jgi:hypothetical protein